MSKRPCSGKCVGGPPRGATRPTMLPRSQPRPRSVGPNPSRTQIQQVQYPRYGQGRIPMQPSVPRPRSALPIQRGPTPGVMRREPPRALPVARRSNLPVPYGQRMVRTQSGSRIPCPRSGRREPAQPTIIVNTRIPRPGQRSNDVNINIRLLLEPREDDYEARELEEFERFERECEELEEFERLERQCELECANAGQAQVLDVVPLTPAQSVQRYREFINTQQGITESGSLRALRRQQDRFDRLANRSAASPTLSSIRQPDFESPAADLSLYKTGSSWSSLVNQPGSMIEDESMGGNTFDRAMWDESYDNVEGWDQVVAAAADDRYDLGNVSMNYESPGCC